MKAGRRRPLGAPNRPGVRVAYWRSRPLIDVVPISCALITFLVGFRRRHRCMRTNMAFAIACGLSTLASTTSAQTPPDSVGQSTRIPVVTDSLLSRLERAERDIVLLRQQLATESAAQVRTRSRLRLSLFARLLTNVYYTSAPSNNPEVPVIARAVSDTSTAYGSGGGRAMGLSLRQTTFGASLSADSVIGAVFSADFEMDFFAGFGADGPPLFPTPRLRTARVFLQWPKTEFMAGADTPLISDLNPVGIAGTGIPDFSGAGNLWNWLPQLRVTRELGAARIGERTLHLALQGALLDPYSGNRHIADVSGLDAGLRAARPSMEGRLRAQWGLEHEPTSIQLIGDRGGEFGVGAHRGWLRVAGDTLTSSWAVSADLRVGLSHGFELRGEAYRGRVVRGLGGGGIGQNFAPSPNTNTLGDALVDVAGWLQINKQISPTVIASTGCGTDRVENARPERQRNTACAAHVTWRPAAPLVTGVEYRGIATRGPMGTRRTNHWNLYFGVEL